MATIPSDSSEALLTFHEKEPVSTLADLKGMDEIQNKIKKNVVLPFLNPSKAALLHMNVPRGVLLCGAPGTGKTVLAEAIVTEIMKTKEVKYYHEAGALISIGDPEKNLRELFKIAATNAPSVIVLDDLDGLGKSRGGGAHMILNTLLLAEINNLVAGEVLLIAATNCTGLCSSALIRKGRFDMVIDVPRPSPPEREEIIHHLFHKKGITLDGLIGAEMAQRTVNCTGSDLKSVVEEIYGNMIDRIFPDGSWIELENEEILEQLLTFNDLDMGSIVEPTLRNLEKANERKANEKVELYTSAPAAGVKGVEH